MPDLIAELLLAYTVPAVLSVPLWIWLGERFEKRTLWLCAMGASAFGFGLLLFLGEGRVGLMLAASIVAGSASGCAPVLGQALKADVIDRDELDTGERKEGAYFAAWMLVEKIASGLVVGAVGIALDLSGFVAGQEQQSDRVVDTMVFLTGGLPAIGLCAGMLVFRRFALTQHEHARVLAELAARRSG
jgi:Na+/melibiose symporter-like transporter